MLYDKLNGGQIFIYINNSYTDKKIHKSKN